MNFSYLFWKYGAYSNTDGIYWMISFWRYAALSFADRRRQKSSSLFSFFFDDWKFFAQASVGLTLFVLFSATKESLMVLDDALSPVFVWQAHAFAFFSLLLPAYLFILAGRCLLPLGGTVLKRLLSFFLFIVFVTCSALNGLETTESSFQWGVHLAFVKTNLYSAIASSVLLFSAFVVLYRFVQQSSGVLIGMVRLTTVIGLLLAFALADRFLVSKGFDEEDVPLEKLRMILILNDFSFSDANDYLTKDSNESFQSSIRFFRPLVLSSPYRTGQLATLFLGMEPYEHGLRTNQTKGHSWSLFQESWLNKKISLKTQSDFHITSLAAPSQFAEFFPEDTSLCPSPTTNQNLYGHLQRIRGKILPFMPEYLEQIAFQHSKCIPLNTPLEDLIHHEIVSQMGQMQRTHRHLVSIWNTDFSLYGSPISENEREEFEPNFVKRKHLAMLFKEILDNLTLLGVAGRTEIHVFGMPSSNLSYGAYFLYDPLFASGEPWPLADENVLTPLSGFSALLDATQNTSELLRPQRKKRNVQNAQLIYFETQPKRILQSEEKSVSGLSSQNTTEALSHSRSVLCAFNESESEERDSEEKQSSVIRKKQATVTISSLFDDPTWTIDAESSFSLSPLPSLKDCVEQSLLEIRKSIDNDVHLFEPYLAPDVKFSTAVNALEDEPQ